MKPKWWNKAKKQLSQRDKVMKKLLNAYKGHLTTRNNFFYSLTRSIISATDFSFCSRLSFSKI